MRIQGKRSGLLALALLGAVLAACAAPAGTDVPPTAGPPTEKPPTTAPIATDTPEATTTPAPPAATAVPMVQPGGRIGDMVVTTGASEAQGPPIWAFCSPAFLQPGVTTTECQVPPLPELAVGHGWFAAGDTLRDANWGAMTWELYLDGQAVDLETFGCYDADLPQPGLSAADPDKVIITKLRSWDVLLTNLQPGAHNLHSVLHLSQGINDGFHTTAPGTYELVADFTVAPPEPTPEPTPSAVPTEVPVLATSADQIVGTWVGTEAHAAFQRFNPDGTYQAAFTRRDLDSGPHVECTFRFEGTDLILTYVRAIDFPSCGPESATYRVQLLPDDRINFVLVRDRCGPRASSTAQVHKRVP
jgi:hypothetical protein